MEQRHPPHSGRAAASSLARNDAADDSRNDGDCKPASLTDLSISDIVASDDVQMRVVGIDPATVASYAEDLRAGSTFPAIQVYHDGEAYHLADGFHRLEAARRVGCETILAEVRSGTSRDAFLAACSANSTHGLRRTTEDKRRAVTALLTDPEFGSQSDRALAKIAAVDHKTVGSIRRDLTEPKAGEFPSVATGTGMVGWMLATVSDEDLLAECRRRGWEVRHV